MQPQQTAQGFPGMVNQMGAPLNAAGSQLNHGGEAHHAQAMRNVLDSLGSAAPAGAQASPTSGFLTRPMGEDTKVENPVDIDAFSAFVSH